MKTEPCYLCQRPVRIDRPALYMHIRDGDIDYGWFPIGNACAKLARSKGLEVEKLDPL